MRTLSESTDGHAGARRALKWTVLAAAGIVAGLCIVILRPFANVIAWSAILAIVCYPVQRRLVRRTGRVALSAFITSVLTVVACVVPLLVLGAIAVNECVALAHSLPSAFQVDGRALTRAAAVVAPITRRVGLGDAAVARGIEDHISDIVRGAAQYTIPLASGVVGAIVSSVLVIFAMFLLLRDGQRLVDAIPDLLPFERRRSEALLHRIRDAVQASVYGGERSLSAVSITCCGRAWSPGVSASANSQCSLRCSAA
jgi:predicted PurR-regulated permease PerM